MKIDLVYLWCDGEDQNWIEKKNFWQKKYQKLDPMGLNNCRYIQHDELKFSLRSVEMYMPWINHIFIVTDNQLPKWLNQNNSKITIINHKEIMPQNALPTFNSNAIEACICNIPGLSEHFLYANDDMMVGRPLTPDFFFSPEGKPYVFLRSTNLSAPCLYTQQIYKAQSLIQSVFGISYPFAPHHNIDAYRLSDVRRCQEIFAQEVQKTIYQKFREKDTFQRCLWGYYALAVKNGILVFNKDIDPRLPSQKRKIMKKNKIYQSISETISSPTLVSKTIYHKNPGLFCLNDNEYLLDEERCQIKWILAQLFPFPSTFENKQMQKWDYDVSIIVPVYNASRYLQRCLDSLLSQSLENIEIICINDGSNDDSESILKKYAQKDKRIKLFSFEKLGPGGCRNIGIDKAKGKYIAFVDADDYVEKNTFLTGYNKIEESKAEILSFNALEIFPCERKKNIFFSANVEKETAINEILPIFFKNRLCCWHLLINHDFIHYHNFYFSPYRYYSEEIMFLLPLFSAAKKIKLIPDYFYHYCRNSSSLISSVPSARLQLIHTICEIKRFLNQKNDYSCMNEEFHHWCIRFSCFAYNDLKGNINYQKMLCKGLKKILNYDVYKKFKNNSQKVIKIKLFGLSLIKIIYFCGVYKIKFLGIPIVILKK